jgi:hypothetical protein
MGLGESFRQAAHYSPRVPAADGICHYQCCWSGSRGGYPQVDCTGSGWLATGCLRPAELRRCVSLRADDGLSVEVAVAEFLEHTGHSVQPYRRADAR